MNFHWNEVIKFLPVLLTGLKMTLIVSAISTVGSTIIGVIVAMMRISKSRILNAIARIYIEWIRGTPLMIQLMFIYFGLGYYINFSAMFAGNLGLSMFMGAYIAEIIRAGIESVPKGQTEAAQSLGMNYYQIMKHIIYPQAIRTVLPPIVSQFITLIKDSSLLSILAVSELSYVSRKIVTRNMAPFEIYLATGLIYLFLTASLSQVVRILERRLKIGA